MYVLFAVLRKTLGVSTTLTGDQCNPPLAKKEADGAGRGPFAGIPYEVSVWSPLCGAARPVAPYIRVPRALRRWCCVTALTEAIGEEKFILYFAPFPNAIVPWNINSCSC